uniref:Opsin 7, group member a n=1 Tax=Salmo trutta TaxID=8032 RepID=A0A673XVH3_SALTR
SGFKLKCSSLSLHSPSLLPTSLPPPGVCSLVGNTILLYVSYNKKMLLKPAEFFIINLAVSDLGMTLSLYPLAVTSSIYHRWLYGKTVCLVYAFCGVLFGICSLTTLTILSTVCCLKVCYPLYGNRFSPDHGRFLIACAWAYALVFPYGTACCIDWSYTVALFLCCYILPCCVITSAYSQILVTVRESRRAVEQHVSQQTRMGNVQTTIVKLSVAVCIGFFAAWSPYALVSMWASFGHMDSIPPMAFAIPAVLAKSSTLYNPLVYLLLKPNFRHLLSKDLHSLHRACVLQCLLACTCFFSSAHKFSMGLRSGLYYQYLDFVVLKPYCRNFESILGVIVHLEDPSTTKL